MPGPSSYEELAAENAELRELDRVLSERRSVLGARLRHRREAKGHITDGKYEEAVIKARAVRDYVREVVPSDSLARDVKPRDRTQIQRWSVLIDDLYSLASGASHDDAVTQGFRWNRNDAVMLVSAVAGLLGRLPRG